MKKTTKNRPRRTWYALGLLLCLGYIFFRKGGLNDIKLGMDLAGGVRLTYQIDYSKYEQQFKNKDQLDDAKKQARDIITHQIDKRISDLGVSNYTAIPQRIDGKEYMVIELGGVSDIDAAKSVIGKTVELEFGLQNDDKNTEKATAERKELAASILKQAKDKDMKRENIGSSNGSQGVEYYALSGTKDALPTMYQKSDILDTLKPGEMTQEPVEGMFWDYPEELASYGLVDQKGYVITRLVDRKSTERKTYAEHTFVSVVPEAKKVMTSEPSQTTTGAAYIADGKIIYPIGAVLSGQAGYNLEVYKYTGTGDLQNVQTTLVAGALIDGVRSTHKGWLAQETLALAVPGFTPQEDKEWTIIQGKDESTIVRLVSSKKANESIFEQYEFAADEDTLTSLQNTLTNPMEYTVDTLFVSEKQPRKTATDPKTGAIFNGAFFEHAKVSQTQLGKPAVSVTFNESGKAMFCRITEANVEKQMAIFVGGEIKTNPVINEKICGGETQITGNFTTAEAQKLVRDLNEGALPAPLILAQEEKVTPALGQQALRHIIQAGIVGIIGVIIYMAIVYGVRYALISAIVLAAFVILLTAALKLIHAVLGLSGLAAIILTLGMSVDATILVFERIQENIKKGQTYRDAVIDAKRQAWSAVRDGNLSTGLIAFLLFTMGVSIFKGFGTMMILTIVIMLLILYPLITEIALAIRGTNQK